ncbi:hypothetical protein PBRA_003605 [Plasmodiophora brassicae]|uniref:Uncharacterized protein n=1 Tax=Plasmodiophora brassicae TaxID=37360 RepID=A0A0G4IHV4_PLABS|nr:hypothetical protein PBRA_003605 [Plasmodiophora brassicae]
MSRQVASKVGESAPTNWRGQRFANDGRWHARSSQFTRARCRLRQQQERARAEHEQEIAAHRQRRVRRVSMGVPRPAKLTPPCAQEREAEEERRQLIEHYKNYGMSSAAPDVLHDVSEAVGQEDLDQLLERNQSLLHKRPGVSPPPMPIHAAMRPAPSTPTPGAAPGPSSVFGTGPSVALPPVPRYESARDQRIRQRQEDFLSRVQRDKALQRAAYIQKLERERMERDRRRDVVPDPADADEYWPAASDLHPATETLPTISPDFSTDHQDAMRSPRIRQPAPATSLSPSPEPPGDRVPHDPVAFRQQPSMSPTRRAERKHEYARVLDEQMQRRGQSRSPRRTAPAPLAESSFPIGSQPNPTFDAERQREYARALEEQMRQRDRSGSPRRAAAPTSPLLGGSETRSTKDAERQRAYARALEEQIRQRGQSRSPRRAAAAQIAESPLLGGSQRNAITDTERKREYARALEEQIQRRHGAGAGRPQPDLDAENRSPLAGIGERTASGDAKRKRRYTLDLQRQIERQGDGGGGGARKRPVSPAAGADGSPGTIAVLGQGERTASDDLARKREYARALQEQIKDQQNRKGRRGQHRDDDDDDDGRMTRPDPLHGRGERSSSGQVARRRQYAADLAQQVLTRHQQQQPVSDARSVSPAPPEAMTEKKASVNERRAKESEYRSQLLQQMEEKARQRQRQKELELEEEANWVIRLNRETEELRLQKQAEDDARAAALAARHKENEERERQRQLLKQQQEDARKQEEDLAERRQSSPERRRSSMLEGPRSLERKPSVEPEPERRPTFGESRRSVDVVDGSPATRRGSINCQSGEGERNVRQEADGGRGDDERRLLEEMRSMADTLLSRQDAIDEHLKQGLNLIQQEHEKVKELVSLSKPAPSVAPGDDPKPDIVPDRIDHHLDAITRALPPQPEQVPVKTGGPIGMPSWLHSGGAVRVDQSLASTSQFVYPTRASPPPLARPLSAESQRSSSAPDCDLPTTDPEYDDDDEEAYSSVASSGLGESDENVDVQARTCASPAQGTGMDVRQPVERFLVKNDRRLRTLKAVGAVDDDPLRRIRSYLDAIAVDSNADGSDDDDDDDDYLDEQSIAGRSRYLRPIARRRHKRTH